MENNHTDIPRVNPGRFKVAIKGTPTFPVRGIVQGVPNMVLIGVLSIVSNRKINTKNMPLKKRPKYQTRETKMPSKGKFGMMRVHN